MQLTKNVQIEEVGAPVSLSSSIDQSSDILDMEGWDGVVFFVAITDSVNTGVAVLTVEQDALNADGSMAALTGAVATATDSGGDDLNNQLLIVDVYKPLKRYLQGVVTSTTANIAFGNTMAIRYKGSKAPITDADSVLHSVAVVSPSES